MKQILVLLSISIFLVKQSHPLPLATVVYQLGNQKFHYTALLVDPWGITTHFGMFRNVFFPAHIL